MKTTRTTKPVTTDAYGNSFFNMSIPQLTELLNSMNAEKKQNWFWKEGIAYRKKHTATMELLSTLINS
jgi:hypothetical protein